MVKHFLGTVAEITVVFVACAAVTFGATMVPYVGVFIGIALALIYGVILGSVGFSDLFRALIFVATATGFCIGLRLRTENFGNWPTILLILVALVGLICGFLYKVWRGGVEERKPTPVSTENPEN
jgi:hypothetical protein